MIYHVYKVNVKHVVELIENVSVMKDAILVFVNHCVVVMMIAATEKYVKILFVLPVVDQIQIALVI